MNSADANPLWVIRFLRIAAALLAGAAIVLWVTPVNAPGRNLVPVGCGSPASPVTDRLSNYVCRDLVNGVRGETLALLVAAALLLLVSEVVLPRHHIRRWVTGAALGLVVALPCFTIALAALFATVAASGADGTLIRCGTPIAPATDAISSKLCGQLPGRTKALSLGVMGLSLLGTVGAGYVASAVRPRDRRESDTDDEQPKPPTFADIAASDLPSVEGRS